MSIRNWHTKVAQTFSICFLNCLGSQRKETMKSEQINLGLSYLPVEIVEEILCRLPVKSVLRFRCVAKSWNNSISSKKFVKTHLKKSAMNMTLSNPRFTTLSNPRFDEVPRHKDYVYCTLKLYSPHSLFYETCETYAVEHRFDHKLNYSSVWIVGYSNGLCCIRGHNKGFILWNPSTRKSRELPPIYNEEFMDLHKFCGFGYDESSEDYKILAVVKTRILISRLYSLKKNSWKTVQNFSPIDDFMYVEPSGLLVNGKLHWTCMFRPDVSSHIDWTYKIVSFDLGSEAVGSLKLPSFVDKQPSSVEGSHLNPTLTVLDGSLCIRWHEQNGAIDIWIMKEYGVEESWCKLIAILPDVAFKLNEITPLCVSRGGEILLLHGSTLIIYNPKENSCRYPKIKDTGFERVTYFRLRHFGFYHESLVSPFPDGE